LAIEEAVHNGRSPITPYVLLYSNVFLSDYSYSLTPENKSSTRSSLSTEEPFEESDVDLFEDDPDENIFLEEERDIIKCVMCCTKLYGF
jgi:hypothetical protein